MCDQYAVISTAGESALCESLGELAAALGLSPLVINSDISAAGCCLCSLDHDRLMAVTRHRFIVRRATDAEGWPFPAWCIEPAIHAGASS